MRWTAEPRDWEEQLSSYVNILYIRQANSQHNRLDGGRMRGGMFSCFAFKTATSKGCAHRQHRVGSYFLWIWMLVEGRHPCAERYIDILEGKPWFSVGRGGGNRILTNVIWQCHQTRESLGSQEPLKAPQKFPTRLPACHPNPIYEIQKLNVLLIPWVPKVNRPPKFCPPFSGPGDEVLQPNQWFYLSCTNGCHSHMGKCNMAVRNTTAWRQHPFSNSW